MQLVEAADEVGGTMRWSPELPGLGEWSRVVGWRSIQLEKLRNVEVITKTRLSAQDVREYGAEIVIVTTGSRWSADGLNGVTHAPIPGADAGAPHILTPEQIIDEGADVPGERVVIYDCDGYFIGASLAEKLAIDGKKVTIVSPEAEIAGFTQATGEAPALIARLYGLGVEMVPHHAVTAIEPGRVLGQHGYNADGAAEWAADSVVLVTQRVSEVGLYRELTADRSALEAEGITGVYRAGDCVQPRIVAESIFDGHRLAREIDSADPAIPLPFHRERWVMAEPAQAMPAAIE